MTYADVFGKHQELVQAHLKGNLENSDPLLPSFFPPAFYWTSSEKDLFFHGLTVYSRLCPDLIAEHIKTKSTFDVCAYLDTLETAALRMSADADTSEGTSRSTIEPAMEVSERWVQREEDFATTLSVLDRCSWSIENVEKDAFRPPSRSSCSSDEQNAKTSGSHSKRNHDQEYWGCLDSTCLMVLESIIREAETEDLDPEALSSTQADSRFLATVVPSEETLLEGLCGSRVFSEEEDQLMTSRPGESAAEITTGKIIGDTYQIASKNEIRRRLQKRFHMRRRRAEKAGIAVVPNALRLRPGRLKKPRKPSKPRPNAYNTKKKLALRANSEPRHISPDPDTTPPSARSVSVDTDEDENLTYEPRSQGGATKPYRVRKLFQEHAVDAQALVGMDLDLFHLSTLARLLRLYTSINEATVDADHVSISAETIQLLVSITTAFVSEIIRHAVITKEQEIRQKRELKVWKYDRDEITAEHVMGCLNTIGLGHFDKKKYLARLLRQAGGEQETASVQETKAEEIPQSRLSNRIHQPVQPFHISLSQSFSWSIPPLRQLFFADDLLSEDIDQTELQRELEEEEILNTEDEKNSKKFEELLWDWEANNLHQELRSGTSF